MSVDGKAFKDCTHKEALHALRLTKDKVKIIIDRKNDTSNLYQDLEVELNKKPGKGLGLSVVGRRDGNGVFISDMVSFYCCYDLGIASLFCYYALGEDNVLLLPYILLKQLFVPLWYLLDS